MNLGSGPGEVVGSSPVVDIENLGLRAHHRIQLKRGCLIATLLMLIGSVLRYALGSSVGRIFSILTVSWVGVCLGCRDHFKAMAETIRPSPE